MDAGIGDTPGLEPCQWADPGPLPVSLPGQFLVFKIALDQGSEPSSIIDPQNDALSEKGLAWPLLQESLKEINTVQNIENIFKAAKAQGFEVFISPHDFFPTDEGWQFNGPLFPRPQPVRNRD